MTQIDYKLSNSKLTTAQMNSSMEFQWWIQLFIFRIVNLYTSLGKKVVEKTQFVRYIYQLMNLFIAPMYGLII